MAAFIRFILAALVLVFLPACARDAAPAGCRPGAGKRVAILVTASGNEPSPHLTVQAESWLREAAERDSTATITVADGTPSAPMPLTPRRTNCQVEHGIRRASLIDGNVAAVVDAVASAAAHTPTVDLLEGIAAATAGSAPGRLIISSSGLSTAGGLDLRHVGWLADPTGIATQLAERNLLPRLAGWQALWIGLGSSAGPQVALPAPVRETLRAYWAAICTAAKANCAFDDTRVTGPPAATAPAGATVDVPAVTSVIGPHGTVTTTIPDSLLGFGPDSAALSPAARETIAALARLIKAEGTVTVTGYTADPPGSTEAGRRRLSLQRAQAVADALAAAGVTNRVTVGGGGAAPGTAVHGGKFDEALATGMRRVEITYNPEER